MTSSRLSELHFGLPYTIHYHALEQVFVRYGGVKKIMAVYYTSYVRFTINFSVKMDA